MKEPQAYSTSPASAVIPDTVFPKNQAQYQHSEALRDVHIGQLAVVEHGILVIRVELEYNAPVEILPEDQGQYQHAAQHVVPFFQVYA